MKKFVLFVFIFVGINLFALSKQAQIDIIKIKLVEQQKKGDYKAIIDSINQWKKLDRKIPSSLIYWEGKSYYQTKDYIKSYKALEKYINKVGQKGRFYKDALKLYLAVEPKYKFAKKKEEFRKLSEGRVISFKDTGLMWQDDYDVISKKMMYYQAVNYCKNLSLGGYSDWRIPNVNELMSIVDYKRTPALKKEFMNPNSTSGYIKHFFSEKNFKSAFYMNPFTGTIFSSYANFEAYVRCVRTISK